MKPTHRIFCPDCGKQKMQFETERKAQTFLKWNASEIEGGENLRPYYCKACCAWHLTHVGHREEYDVRMDERINAYRESESGQKWQNRLERLARRTDTNMNHQKWRKIKNPKM